MNTSQNVSQAIIVAPAALAPHQAVVGAPSVPGEPVRPIVVQCRPPSKIGCIINSPTKPIVQGEPVKSTTVQPVNAASPCGDLYATDAAPDVGVMLTIFIAGFFGNCR